LTLDIERLIFLDESGVNTGMTRLYGRALKGRRLVDYTPDVRFERTSILSSVRLTGATIPMAYSGALDGELFVKYITDFLAPTLKVGDIVIMDNLSSHKVKGVIEPIVIAGATVLYLPPYSPDFNPIEQLWSKIKSFLRKIKARTTELLMDAIAAAFKTISLADIKNWFLHDGYSTRFVK
jgi:transposase